MRRGGKWRRLGGAPAVEPRAAPSHAWRPYVGGAKGVRGDYGGAPGAADRVLLRKDASVLPVRAGDTVHDAGGLLRAAGHDPGARRAAGHGDRAERDTGAQGRAEGDARGSGAAHEVRARKEGVRDATGAGGGGVLSGRRGGGDLRGALGWALSSIV